MIQLFGNVIGASRNITVPAEDWPAFAELIQRGSNLWPDAPIVIKEFADLVTNGQVMQDYRKIAGLPSIANNPYPMKPYGENTMLAQNQQQQTKAIHLDMEAIAAQALATFPGALAGGSSEQALAQLQSEEQILPISRFEEMVLKFNEVYGLLQFHTASRQEMADRLKVFKNLMLEELGEIDEIIARLERGVLGEMPAPEYLSPIDAITDIADLCGDLQVFAASEMARFNIPITPTLHIIMDSNMSKLDADGNPIYRESDGKVMKGPNYWKPEPKIRRMLEMHLSTEIRGEQLREIETPADPAIMPDLDADDAS